MSGRRWRALLAGGLLLAAAPFVIRGAKSERAARAHSTTRYIRNTGATPLPVWVEPWAYELRVPPAATFRFIGRAENAGDFEMERTEKGVSVYAWPSSRLTVYYGERQVLDCPEPVPGTPSGVAASSFVKTMFGGDARAADGKYPTCQIW